MCILMWIFFLETKYRNRLIYILICKLKITKYYLTQKLLLLLFNNVFICDIYSLIPLINIIQNTRISFSDYIKKTKTIYAYVSLD